ncbi:helix-turn-helix domain-containing protein [Spirillospora sp. NPDC047279]|uniref:helix-turn-helix domain-containing protein n=1 Tax=Spirillospora sp. NPDC047279 TaxID=3155478 RepID=UPI0033E21FD8
MTPRLGIGEGYAFYQGPTRDSGVHRHAAFQIAVAVDGEVSIVDAAGTEHRGAALAVAPMAPHRMLAAVHLRAFFVEPHCAFADRVRDHCAAGVVAVPQLRGISEDDVRHGGGRPSDTLDPRLMAAMRALMEDRPDPMPEIAARVGLSTQRLRALARAELGMPLQRWRIWHRLRRATEAVREGRSLAEAAEAGGFADQAHFTRRLREMMGLTPAEVLPLLRRSGTAPGIDRDRAGDR